MRKLVRKPRRGVRLDEDDELAELEQRLNSAELPEHALKVARKELKVVAVLVFPVITPCVLTGSACGACLPNSLSMLCHAITWRH